MGTGKGSAPVGMMGGGSTNAWFTLGLICVGVGCLFGSQNIMAPNLTSIAEEFSFDRDRRDRLLGAEMSLAYSVYSMPGAVLLGLLADCCARKRLFVGVVGVGALCTLGSAYVDTYSQLRALRVLAGMCTNAVIPIAFSFLGDLYSPEERSLPSTLVTAAMGVGILLGQIVAGFFGPRMGWRAAFIVVALPGLLAAALTVGYISEPMRGASERAVAELIRSGAEYQPKRLGWQAFVAMMRIKTNLLLITQALPGTIPWGVLFAYLNDFLSQEKGLPVEQATLLVSLFGIGSAVGGVGGGLLGQIAYKRSKALLPVLMSVSTILSTLPMFVLINASYDSATTVLVLVVPATFIAGVLANINGTNVRPLLLNVNLPETRGAVVSVANLVANLGKGIGPSIANYIMHTHHGSRQFAFNVTISLWFVCGLLVAMLVCTLLHDEAMVQEELRKKTAAAMGLPLHSLSSGSTSSSSKRGQHHRSSGDEEDMGPLLPQDGVHDSSSTSEALLHRHRQPQGLAPPLPSPS